MKSVWNSYSFKASMGLFQAFCGCRSVTNSCLTLPPHGRRPARTPCPLVSPSACSKSCHWVSDAIWPPHPLPPLSAAFNLSQHQALFQWVSSSHQVTKVWELQLSSSVPPMNIQGWFPLAWTGLISLLPKRLSRVLCGTGEPVPQFESISSSLLSLLYSPALTSIHDFDYTDLCQQSDVSIF